MENQQRVSLPSNWQLVGKLVAPTHLTLGKKKPKKYSISMNTYRNVHYQVKDDLKELYKTTLESQILALPQLHTISLIYVLYPQRVCDVTNFCCVQSKFLLDAIVELGRLKNDSYQYVITEIFTFGSKSKTNPRVEIFIYESCL